LAPFLNELFEKQLLIDENSINSYEEIISLLKLPQLKDLCKQFHIHNPSNSLKLRSEFIKLILNHFKTQKSLKFHVKSQKLHQNEESNVSPENAAQGNNLNKTFMNQCKKLLGKCYRLEKTKRDVFVRILMLYNLSSSYNSDVQKGNDSGQHQL
jgi:hypothetical protein